MLSSIYLVEYTLHQNLMIEIYTRNFDLHITVPSPNLAFLCRNLDYKPYSINLALQKENGCNIEMYCIDDNVNNISSNHAINVEHVSNAITLKI